MRREGGSKDREEVKKREEGGGRNKDREEGRLCAYPAIS